jgi:hypothetical protein
MTELAKLDFERVLGITKTSLKNKILVWFDSEDSRKALTLLSRRGRQYTKEELGFLHLFMLSGHDACVVDNTDEYSAVEVYTALQNHILREVFFLTEDVSSSFTKLVNRLRDETG